MSWCFQTDAVTHGLYGEIVDFSGWQSQRYPKLSTKGIRSLRDQFCPDNNVSVTWRHNSRVRNQIAEIPAV
jgi:hypothetical protein